MWYVDFNKEEWNEIGSVEKQIVKRILAEQTPTKLYRDEEQIKIYYIYQHGRIVNTLNSKSQDC